MLKCIHKTPAINQEATKFVTDFYHHYILFENSRATLFDIDGRSLSQFECRDNIQEAVFADDRAIVTTDTRTLYFYNLKDKTLSLVKPKNPVHSLLPGPDSISFYFGTRHITNIVYRLIKEGNEGVVLKVKRVNPFLSEVKKLYREDLEPVDISISHFGPKTCVFNKTPEVVVFSGPKFVRTVKSFPLPIFRAFMVSFETLYWAGAQGNIIKIFDENAKEIFAKELPFAIKDILAMNSDLVAVCEFGVICVLNAKGDIIDSGFLTKEIIDCRVSSDGLLWCLTDDSSLMIIGRRNETEVEEIGQWLHMDMVGRKSPLQEVLLKINETEQEQTSKEALIQEKSRQIHRKETELKKLESRFKKDAAEAKTLLDQVQEREKSAETLMAHAKELEANMKRMDSIEELSKRLLEHRQRATEDKTKFPEIENEINGTIREIKDIENRKMELTTSISQKREELSQLSDVVKNLASKEENLNLEFSQANKKLSDLKASIAEKEAFIQDAPQRMQSLEQEEQGFASKIVELEKKIAVISKRVEKVQSAKAKLEKRFHEKAKELDQILSSAKNVREKEKDIPKIQELTQKLIALIEEVQGGGSRV